MSTITPRNYNCKDVELPVICGFVSKSLKRDLSDFFAYSARFTPDYVSTFDASIEAAINIVDPQSETMERKMINNRIRETISGLLDPVNRVSGYITLSSSMKMSPADFGLVALRASINAMDIEDVIDSLHVVNANIVTYKDALAAEGMSTTLAEVFVSSATAIASDKQLQYTIVSTRRSTVQNNIQLLNDLYDQLTKILNVGKILYKTTNAAKLSDYTFANLKKQVHIASKTPVVPPAIKPATDSK